MQQDMERFQIVKTITGTKMKTLKLEEIENLNGGDFVGGLCVGIGAGSVVYGVGVLTNWWNPVGWVSAAFLVADAACIGYAASNI
jgi:hypothetical protein